MLDIIIVTEKRFKKKDKKKKNQKDKKTKLKKKKTKTKKNMGNADTAGPHPVAWEMQRYSL